MAERYTGIVNGEAAKQAPDYLGITATPEDERRKKLEGIPFSGFSPENGRWHRNHGIESETWTKYAIAAIGLPVDNIDQVIFTNNTHETQNTLGSWGIGGSETGKYRLYKLLKDIPVIAQVGTMSHELAHANSPFNVENNNIYGSQEKREKALNHAKAVALQTDKTGVYLNGYHASLHDNLKAVRDHYPEDSDERKYYEALFEEETNAIMIQLRFENPKHLKEVEEAQHASLERRRRGGQDVPEPVTIMDGVNNTLVALIKEVDNPDQLDAHIQKVRTRYAQDDRSANSFTIRSRITSRRQQIGYPKAA